MELLTAWLTSFLLPNCFTLIKASWASNSLITTMSHILQAIAASHASIRFYNLLKSLICWSYWIIMEAVMLKLWLQLKQSKTINRLWTAVFTINVIQSKTNSNIIGLVPAIIYPYIILCFQLEPISQTMDYTSIL